MHTPDRRKVWLACDEHRESLADFLGARGSSRTSVPHQDTRDGASSAADRGHRPVGLEERRVVDAVTGAPCRPSRPRQRSASSSSVAPARSAARRSDSCAGEQAVADLAVGGEPDPVAVAAERPGHRRDHADRGRAAVDEEQLGRGAPPRLGRPASARTRCSRRGEDLVGGDHRRRGPSRAGRRAASAR